MGPEAPSQVLNPYRGALEGAIRRARPVVTDCATALDGAVAAMKGHAWVSPSGDAFFAALRAAAQDAERAGAESLAELRAAVAANPEMVDSGSWQVHWRALR